MRVFGLIALVSVMVVSAGVRAEDQREFKEGDEVLCKKFKSVRDMPAEYLKVASTYFPKLRDAKPAEDRSRMVTVDGVVVQSHQTQPGDTDVVTTSVTVPTGEKGKVLIVTVAGRKSTGDSSAAAVIVPTELADAGRKFGRETAVKVLKSK